ncbi:hypothetical protein HZS_5574 [Henneguya salminicola]|nr:hypothetical protein HZS_5574 [Henneguya salminicola]
MELYIHLCFSICLIFCSMILFTDHKKSYLNIKNCLAMGVLAMTAAEKNRHILKHRLLLYFFLEILYLFHIITGIIYVIYFF